MNDRPDPDHLASAYLDGELTADERALVEASPDLMRLVEGMQSVRLALRHVPVDDLHRSGAVRAALAEYDRRLAPGDGAAAVVASLEQQRRRRRPSQVLAVAAAALLVGVVGVSVLGGDRGTSDPAAVSEQRGTAKQAADPAVPASNLDAGAVVSAESSSVASLPVSTIAAINEPASAAYVVNDAAALLALPDPATTDGLASGCPLEADETVVARIIWVDTTAWAVRSTSGAMRVLDLACTTLATAAP